MTRGVLRAQSKGIIGVGNSIVRKFVAVCSFTKATGIFADEFARALIVGSGAVARCNPGFCQRWLFLYDRP